MKKDVVNSTSFLKLFKMKEFEVIALSVGTKHGVKKTGDIVTKNDFPDGHLEKMVDGNFIKEVSKKTKEKAATAKTESDAKAKEEKAEQENAVKVAEENAEKAKSAQKKEADKKKK